jgi:hypothetical protein
MPTQPFSVSGRLRTRHRMVKPIGSTGEQSSLSHRTNRLQANNGSKAVRFHRPTSVVNTHRKAAGCVGGDVPSRHRPLHPAEAGDAGRRSDVTEQALSAIRNGAGGTPMCSPTPPSRRSLPRLVAVSWIALMSASGRITSTRQKCLEPLCRLVVNFAPLSGLDHYGKAIALQCCSPSQGDSQTSGRPQGRPLFIGVSCRARHPLSVFAILRLLDLCAVRYVRAGGDEYRHDRSCDAPAERGDDYRPHAEHWPRESCSESATEEGCRAK